jgi:hypothetical protein
LAVKPATGQTGKYAIGKERKRKSLENFIDGTLSEFHISTNVLQAQGSFGSKLRNTCG